LKKREKSGIGEFELVISELGISKFRICKLEFCELANQKFTKWKKANWQIRIDKSGLANLK